MVSSLFCLFYTISYYITLYTIGKNVLIMPGGLNEMFTKSTKKNDICILKNSAKHIVKAGVLCFTLFYCCLLCYVMLCYVMLCYNMLCYVMLCYVMLCYVMLCYLILYYVTLCYVMLC